jgi:4-diphosphocytidyl-2-C-methyl-D-erythritol kinase
VIATKAPAKINIGLKILNKREDGYHNIETTLSTISLFDDVELEETGEGVEIQSPGLKIAQPDNLCYKAARLIIDEFKVKRGVKITLNKKIPVGGGLGGGSSDAAAVLKGLNALWNLGITEEKLMTLGRKLGCDVPFFIRGGSAYVRGVGDELKYFQMPKLNLTIYYPGYPISTKWAYDEYDKKVLTPRPEMDIIVGKKKPKTGMAITNDFEPVVFAHHPDLLDVKSHLLASGALVVSLSGSGSCLYVVTDENIKKKVLKYLLSISAIYFEAVTVQ